MTNESELNKKLHKARFPDKCLETERVVQFWPGRCVECGQKHGVESIPDYLDDLEAAFALVEWLVEEKGYVFRTEQVPKQSLFPGFKPLFAEFARYDEVDQIYRADHASLATAISLAAARCLGLEVE